MAATQTVDQSPQPRNSGEAHRFQKLRHGVLTLFGYGINVRVDRGHLLVEDGIGADRRRMRVPRVGHGLRRLVVVGNEGLISLAALRWIADQNVSFLMLERDGSVLATTGPVAASDARLRRAQALAYQSNAGLEITRELITRKLSGQDLVARDSLRNPSVAEAIARFREALVTAENVEIIRQIESRAAHAYWSAWRSVPINFPRVDVGRVPDHWRKFGARISPLSGSPRLAVNPPNAILNYLYALLESEARLAAAALGLDPGLGVLHFDSRTRDSLACDLMEPVRPQVDAFVLDWLTREQLSRKWFFEQHNGNCRLMASLAVRLSETAPTWGRAVAPIAEWVARTLWTTTNKPTRQLAPATRLTQRHKRDSRGGSSVLPTKAPPRPQSLCRVCGDSIKPGGGYCPPCTLVVSAEGLREVAKQGRVAAQAPEAQERRAATKRRHDAALSVWSRSDHPAWLTAEYYDREIQPRLATLTVNAISSAIGVCEPYATDIRAGRKRPHPRHWQTLASLVG